MKRLAVLLCACFFLLFSGVAFGVPREAPPPGKVWIEVGGEWIAVVVPPGDGPFIWKGNKWILDTTPPPPGSEWVPGHWVPGQSQDSVRGAGHWVAGHWEAVPLPGKKAKWISGHWKGNTWIPGHWAGGPPKGKKWIPGRHGPGGQWIPGHWR